MSEEKFIHVKRERKKGKGHGNGGNKQQNHAANGGFFAEGHHNRDQREGNFSFDTIHGLKLKEVEYTVPSKAERVAKRNEFNGVRDENGNVVVEGVRSKFLKMLANEHADLLVERLGLTERDIEGMREGYTPNGFNVHHKLALHGGGKNEFSNFILTPLYPHDQWHHDVMDAQLLGIREGETRTIKIPYTDEMIYDPKQFGFTRENQPVKPNYTSNVNPANYPELYKPEHISVAKRQKDMAEFYASLDEKKAQQAAQQNKAETGKSGKNKLPMREIVQSRQLVRNRQRD